MDTSPSASFMALHATVNGNLRLLKSTAKKVDLRGVKDTEGHTALHHAVSKGFLEICRFLVQKSRLDVNSLTNTGATPMFYAALRGHVEVMRYLLKRGGDPTMPDDRGSTPLHSAAEEGHCEAVILLLSEGVPVDPVNYMGTPLHFAATRGHADVLKILLEHGADPNKMAGHFSPVSLACCVRSLKCIKLLIQAGADVNAHGVSGPTPLTKAVEFGFTDVVKLLLEAGADPNIPNQFDAIPVEQAAALGRRDLVEVLLPWTKPIPSQPDWTVDGIIRTVHSMRMTLKDTVSKARRIADLKSRGNAAFEKEEYVAAINFFGLVADMNPVDADMYANMSDCWLRVRVGGEALLNARKCRILLPRCPMAWYREGAALSLMKDYDGAADAFREALRLDPESEEVRAALRNADKAAGELQRRV